MTLGSNHPCLYVCVCVCVSVCPSACVDWASKNRSGYKIYICAEQVLVVRYSLFL